MPNNRRWYADGGTYFLTVCLDDRRSDLLVREIGALRASWREAFSSRRFETVAAVILPDHIQLIWRLPSDDHDFPTRLSQLKAGFTRRLPADVKSEGRKRERGVWQPRYWEHLIRDDDDLARHIAYIHWNPVKHGHVGHPDDWPLSTRHRWKLEFRGVASAPATNWTPLHLGEAEAAG